MIDQVGDPYRDQGREGNGQDSYQPYLCQARRSRSCARGCVSAPAWPGLIGAKYREGSILPFTIPASESALRDPVLSHCVVVGVVEALIDTLATSMLYCHHKADNQQI